MSPSIFGIYLGIKQKKDKIKKYPCTWVSGSYSLNAPFTPSARRLLKGNFSLAMFTFFPVSKLKASIEIFTLVPFISDNFWKNASLKALIKRLIKTAQEEFSFEKSNIEAIKMATPFTFEIYTLNTHGVAFGWKSSVDQIRASTFPLETSVKGLFIAGQWGAVGSGQGGIPKVAFCGRKTAQLVLKCFEKKWRYSIQLIT